ncbi:MAG TPA: flavodoxin family protein [Candidatus Nanoarchaeia archaeon]|nr:flavodoxin family protein [Candidatus Nanoarchaeia archaeon]
MNVLGFVASPRRGANTDLIVSAILYGAGSANHTIDKVYLYDVDIGPCVDCQACKKTNHKCAIGDGMQLLYPKLEAADVIVFGTPLYWYGPSAKMKLLVDRLRPLIGSQALKGRKAVLVIPSEEGEKACRHAVGMFKLSFDYLGVDIIGKFLPRTEERTAVKRQPQILNEAFEMGKNLG